MTTTCTVHLLRAGDVGHQTTPRLTVNVFDQISDYGTLDAARSVYREQGELLAGVLLASLPGGTVDALLGELMRRRASLFSVPLFS